MAGLLLRLLRHLVDADLAESIVGDLVEERHRRWSSSPTGAVWFAREAILLWGRVLLAILGESAVEFRRMLSFTLLSPGESRRILRSFRRSSPFVATVTAVVALTTMVAVTTFAIVDGVLFKPLPYRDASRLYDVSAGYSDELRARTGTRVVNRWGLGLSLHDMRDLAAAVPGTTFTAIGGGRSSAAVGDLREWTPVVARADQNFFEVTGLRPLLGGFVAGDFEPSTVVETPVLISQGLWRSQFDRRLDVVGRVLQVRTETGWNTYRVRGVLPADFLFPSAGLPNLLAPLVVPPSAREDRAARDYRFLARLPPGADFDRAQAAFNNVARLARSELPDRRENGGAGPTDIAAFRPIDGVLRDRVRPAFLSVFAAATALVLLGSLSVSGLFTSRVGERLREFTVRQALGASRSHIAITVAFEIVAALTLGTVVGLALTPAALRIVVHLMPANAGLLKAPTLDWRLVGFLCSCFAVSAFLTAFEPIRRSLQMTGPLRGRQARRGGRTTLIALQVAVGLVLTVAGTLLIGSLVRVWQRDIGLDLTDVSTLEGEVSSSLPVAVRKLVLDGFLDEVRHLPGVISAGATSAPLMRRSTPGGEFYADTYPVTSGFLEAWRPRLLSGRMPSADELEFGAPVALISEGVARRYFGATPAIGQHLSARNTSYAVVGLVADAQNGAWDASGGLGGQIYRPWTPDRPYFTMAVRVVPGHRSLLDAVLAVPSVATGSIVLQRSASAHTLLSETISERRLRAWLYGTFAVGALTILAAGLLGMVTMDVIGRTKEIGVRFALGARTAHVMSMLVREQLVAVVLGIASGTLVAWWGVRLVEADLYQLTGHDARLWGMAVATLLIVVLVATLIPAARVASIDPADALRVD